MVNVIKNNVFWKEERDEGTNNTVGVGLIS